MTEGKQFLIDQSASELEIYLTEAMHNNAGEFETPMVSARKLLSDVEMYGPATIRGRVGIKAVQYFLLQHGYKPHDCHVYEEGQRVHRRLYYKGRAADFARMVEEINAKAGHGAAAHNQVGKVKKDKG